MSQAGREQQNVVAASGPTIGLMAFATYLPEQTQDAAYIAEQSGIPEQIVREIKRLEAQMYKHARNLEFEEAAKIRDTIEQMKQQELGLNEPGMLAG